MEAILKEIKWFRVHPKNLKNIGLRKRQTKAKRLRQKQKSKNEKKGLFDIDKDKKRYKILT